MHGDPRGSDGGAESGAGGKESRKERKGGQERNVR